MAKGSAFEREICKRLSLWWTQDLPEPRDDIFWRSSNSGGRATVRGKRGKKTANQYGDIAATDPIGLPLLQFVTIELKRGYNRDTIFDCVDSCNWAKATQYEKWIQKIERDRAAAGATSWLLIHKRDRREAMVYFPRWYYTDKEDEISLRVRVDDRWIDGMRLEHFLKRMIPDDFRT